MGGQRSNPHDAYFRQVMSRPSAAASELRAALPESVSARVDWGALRLESTSFVHPDLRNRVSDLLFRTRVDGRCGYVYVLVEHQSRSDRLMAFRMLEYMVAIWRRHLNDNDKATTLPAIIPLVVHNNAEGTGWCASHPTELADLLDLDSGMREVLGPHVPRLRFLLDDVAVLDPAVLRARDLTPAAMVLLVLQRIAPRNHRLGHDMLDLLEDLRALDTGPDSLGDFRTVLTYILTVGETSEADVAAVFERIGPRAKEAVVTTAEIIEARGEARGRVAALLEVLCEVLTSKFGPLPEPVDRRIRSADPDQIRVWTVQAATAATLDELFA